MRKAAWAGLAVIGLFLAACGTTPPARSAAKLARPALTTFDGHAIWYAGARSHRRGLAWLQHVTSPWSYESLELNQYGPGRLLYAASSGPLPKNGDWGAGIKLGKLRSFTVNGIRYTVPAAFAGMDMAVLPLAQGMVWLATPQAGPENMVGPTLGTKNLNPAALAGATEIYYTPYLAKGGSLLRGRQTIAALPHSWTGFDGPVAASAWAGWLRPAEVRAPRSVTTAAHELSYGSGQRLSGNQVVRTALPGYPSLFLHQVPSLQAGGHAIVAWVQKMTRTAGGFVLQVQFFDTNDGLDADGLLWADYYWSESQASWTPLTQIFGQQDILSFVDVGSRAVYWQQALAGPPGDGSRLDLVQMRFDPATDQTAPIWAGGYIYGQTFVDGSSWVHDMLHLNHGDPTLPAVSVWSENTP